MKATLSIHSTQMGNYSISVHNVLGATIQNFNHSHISETSEVGFSLPASGLYIVHVAYEKGGMEVFKLIVGD